MPTTKVDVKAITRAEWGEFVTVTGYLRLGGVSGAREGHNPVVVSGMLTLAIHYANDGWSKLTVGTPSSVDVWVPPNGQLTVETANKKV